MYSHEMTISALIIGGGIAGPISAMALQRAGLEPTVYEEYEQGSDGAGLFLTLAVNGLAALDVIGARDLVEHLGMETPGMKLINGAGKELGAAPMAARTVPRTDLYTALRDEAVRRGVRIEYGKRLDDARVTGAGVEAVFGDGTTARGDLLIGADGLRSRTRTLIDPRAPQARHIGLLNTGGYAHDLRLDAPPGVAHFVFGRRCFFGYFVHPDGGVWWFANPPSKHEPTRAELQAITPDAWRARLVDLFAHDSGPMPDIIAATDRIFPAWNTYDFPTVPTWHNDRMVIIGDAAHATSPSSGQGASMAIEDAIVLARCLRDAPDPATGFAAYEKERRSRVERVVAYGKRNGSGKAPGPVGAAIRDLVLPMIMRKVAKSSANNWMTDYRIDWDGATRRPARA
jgi:2-polyprenyl-6-methoxyphenol hydroxylase-like FAD-dependent oxidoreductase